MESGCVPWTPCPGTPEGYSCKGISASRPSCAPCAQALGDASTPGARGLPGHGTFSQWECFWPFPVQAGSWPQGRNCQLWALNSTRPPGPAGGGMGLQRPGSASPGTNLPQPANCCAPAGLHSYFFSKEDLPRQCTSCTGASPPTPHAAPQPSTLSNHPPIPPTMGHCYPPPSQFPDRRR